MRLNKVWEGRLPSHWDVTAWTALVGHHLVVCYRDVDTRKRMLGVYDLLGQTSALEESVYNIILGSLGHHIYFAHVSDARAHLQLKRVSDYDIICRSVHWTLNDSFLIEKFKIPAVTPQNASSYALGNKWIDLQKGELLEITKPAWQQRGWEIGNGLRLEQQGTTTLLCMNGQEPVWAMDGVLGNRYHGVQGDTLYFLLADDQLLLVNRTDGVEQARLHLAGVKKVSDRLDGSFDYKNDRSFNSCTVADALIHNDLVVWVTEQNQLVIHDIRSGRATTVEMDGEEYDLCLSAMNNDYILLYGIKDADNGSLLIVRLEDLGYGASGDRSK